MGREGRKRKGRDKERNREWEGTCVCGWGGGVTLAHRLTGSLSLISSIFPSSFGFILLFVFLVFLHPSLLFSFYTPFPILFLSLLLSFQATSHPLSLSPFSLFTPFLPFSSRSIPLSLSLPAFLISLFAVPFSPSLVPRHFSASFPILCHFPPTLISFPGPCHPAPFLRVSVIHNSGARCMICLLRMTDQ